ncbi:MAG TPA: hypothetical protein VFU97_09190 [Xanthobacteraceae bacterium]|nr:hypothetical protein [Xanthobacteraceae bacterium]
MAMLSRYRSGLRLCTGRSKSFAVQSAELRLLFGDAAADEIALQCGELRPQQCPVASDVLPVRRNPDHPHIGHGNSPSPASNAAPKR